MENTSSFPSESLLGGRIEAEAALSGSPDYPGIEGTVKFYSTDYGVLVSARFSGLPLSTVPCGSAVFGFHIHSGASCTGNEKDPFADAGTHYSPKGLPHSCHEGDLPPIFGCGGAAFSAFLTDRFTIEEIIGKTVILHDSPDDFKTQPAGDSGMKIACGMIRRVPR